MRTDNEIRPWFEDETEVEPELDDDEMIQLFNERSKGVVLVDDGAYLG
jgi:hypothetical protein